MTRFLKYKAVIIVMALLALTGNIINAQGKLTIEECREKAVDYNKELKKANLQKEEAVASQKAARTAYLPSLKAEANAMHISGLDDISTPGYFLPTAESEEAAQMGQFSGISDVWSPGMTIEMNNLNVVYGGLSLSQPVYTGGKIATSNKMADVGVDMAALSYDLKYSEIIELNDQAFWNVAMVEANINLAEKYIEMLTETEDMMTAMYDVGLQPASEKLKVTVQKNEAELQLMMAKNGLKIAKMNLNQILGNDLEKEINITYDSIDNIQLITMTNGIQMANENRDELLLLKKNIEMSALDKKMVVSDYLPQLGVGIQYQGTYVSDFAEDVEFSPIVAAQLSVPIFQWGQKNKKKRAAQFKIKQNEMELSHSTDLIHLQVQNTKVKVEEAYEAILIAEKNIVEAQESLDETKSSFEVGLNSTTDLLIAQTNWLKARLQRIQAVAKYKTLETTWKKVTGQLKPE